MNPRVFREYDIRGQAERDFPDDFVRALGRALGSLVRRGAPDSQRPTMAVGRDCRLTSPRLHAALLDGITATGVHVLDIGVVPTPILYFASHHFEVEGAVIITGSHNPAEDNGFKLLHQGKSLHGAAIQELRAVMERQDFVDAGDAGRGSVTERDADAPYLENAVASLRLGERRFKVVVDGGNGAGGPTACALFSRLGFEVVPLFCDMDGNFPNHHPDPTVAKNLTHLIDRVQAEGAELGIALDGDGDRIGAIDGQGHIVWGDQLMILFGRAILEEHPGATFIGEVKCSQALYDELEKAGGNPIMWAVGHSRIKAKMLETGALLAGEMSGHIFFAHRYLGFDDASYAGARLLEILSRSEQTLADLYATLPVMVNTPEIRMQCPDDVKFAVVARATERLRGRDDVHSVVDVDGARANFGDGWGLVRASNTQPALVVRCEASSEERLQAIRAVVEQEIAAARAELQPS